MPQYLHLQELWSIKGFKTVSTCDGHSNLAGVLDSVGEAEGMEPNNVEQVHEGGVYFWGKQGATRCVE